MKRIFLLTSLFAVGISAISLASPFKIQDATNRGCLQKSEPAEIEQPLSFILTKKLKKWLETNRLAPGVDPFEKEFATPILPPAAGNPRFDFSFEKPEDGGKTAAMEMSYRDAMIEGYFRPRPTTYRLIPGLGIGASTGANTWVYFCMYLPDSDNGNEMVIHFLEASASKKSDSVKVKTKTVNLEVDPIGGVFNLLLGPTSLLPNSTTELTEFDQRMVKKNASITGTILQSLLGIIGTAGVNRIEVNPRKFILSLESRIVVAKVPGEHVEKIDMDWMVKPSNQKRIFGEKKTKPVKK